MAISSLFAALVALRWSRIKVDKLIAWRKPGAAGAFGYGAVFSLGTSVAPLLLLLTIAAAGRRPEYGLLIAFVFGLGRGAPFLLAGVAGSAVTSFAGLGSWSRAIQIASVAALLLVSAYYTSLFVELL
jgi:cytochrome c-type biogenesis protein